MNEMYYLDEDGEALPIVAEHQGHRYAAHVLRDESPDVWVIIWTDGINTWKEEYHLPWQAFARLAALVAAAEQDVFLVHDPSNRGATDGEAFRNEVERFVSRTVHASSCRPGCDGTDPVNHVGFVDTRADVWDDYWESWRALNQTDEHPHDEASHERQEDLVNWLLNNR